MTRTFQDLLFYSSLGIYFVVAFMEEKSLSFKYINLWVFAGKLHIFSLQLTEKIPL